MQTEDNTNETKNNGVSKKWLIDNSLMSFRDFDHQSKILTYTAGGGLLTLGLSTSLKWINLGAGGSVGISGDGKIVLALTMLAFVGYLFAICKNKWVFHILIAIQGWGTIAAFWMGTLLWKASTFLSTGEINDNPFAFLVASQVGPGIGLYLGLLSGLVITGTLGYVFIRHPIIVRLRHVYYIAFVIGTLLAIYFLMLPSGTYRNNADLKNSIIGKGRINPFPHNTLLTPSLIGKKFRSNDYRAAILLDIGWDTSELKKPTRAIKGILHITDIFGESKVSSKFTVDIPLYPKQEYIQKDFGIEYNQFDDSHSWLRYAQLNNIKIVFEITDVMYLDEKSIQEFQNINNEMQDAKKASTEGDYSKAKNILDNIIKKWQEKCPDQIKEADDLRKDVLREIEIKKQQIEESRHQEVCAQIDKKIQSVKQLIENGDEFVAIISLNDIIANCPLNCNEKLEEARNLMVVIQQKKERKEQMEQLAKHQEVCVQIDRELQSVKQLIEKKDESEAITSLNAIIENCNLNCPEKLEEAKNIMRVIQQKKEQKEQLEQLAKLKTTFKLATDNYELLQKAFEIKTSRLYISTELSLRMEFCFKNNTQKTISCVDLDYQVISLNSSRSGNVKTVNISLSDGLEPGEEKTFYIKPDYSAQFSPSVQVLVARPKQVYDSNDNPIFTPNPSTDEEKQLESIAEKFNETKISSESLEVLNQYREQQKFNTKTLLQIKTEIAELERLKKEVFSLLFTAENETRLKLLKKFLSQNFGEY